MPAFLDERLPARFWDKAQPCPMSGCWLWTACVDEHGYGRIRMTALRPDIPPSTRAHRLAYLVLVGDVPDGMELDHRVCRTPCCVNPAHLEPVTHRVNILRGNGMAGRHARASHCKLGHTFDDANTMWMRDGRTGRMTRRCRRCRADKQRAWVRARPGYTNKYSLAYRERQRAKGAQ